MVIERAWQPVAPRTMSKSRVGSEVMTQRDCGLVSGVALAATSLSEAGSGQSLIGLSDSVNPLDEGWVRWDLPNPANAPSSAVVGRVEHNVRAGHTNPADGLIWQTTHAFDGEPVTENSLPWAFLAQDASAADTATSTTFNSSFSGSRHVALARATRLPVMCETSKVTWVGLRKKETADGDAQRANRPRGEGASLPRDCHSRGSLLRIG